MPGASTNAALSTPTTRVSVGGWKPIATVVAVAAAVLVGGLFAIDKARGRRPRRPCRRPAWQPRRGDAIRARDGELAKCAAKDGDAFSRRISFTPDQVEHSPLGGCMRDVFATAVFPAVGAQKDLALAVRRQR